MLIKLCFILSLRAIAVVEAMEKLPEEDANKLLVPSKNYLQPQTITPSVPESEEVTRETVLKLKNATEDEIDAIGENDLFAIAMHILVYSYLCNGE